MRLQYLIRSRMSNKGFYDNIREGQIEDLVKEAFQTQQEKRTAEIKVQQLEKQIEDLKLTSSDKLPRKKSKKEQEKELWDKNNPKEYVDYLKTLVIDHSELHFQPIPVYDAYMITVKSVCDTASKIKTNKAVMFGDCINFGMMLAWVKLNHNGSFEKWLKENINMSKRQAERYMKLVPLHQYHKFYALAIEMTNIYDKVETIITYIGCSQEEREFWKS